MEMPPLLQYEDYTVAWIAALPIEVEAAIAALDRRHEGQFLTLDGDDYTYIGGDINGHKVLIAKLPRGQVYGIGSAAALVSHVKARFHNIRFALLVGVAAGLPNLATTIPSRKRDIRLGDILVSVPEKKSTGIIQYDLGTDSGVGIEPSGRLSETPAIVRSAIGDIELLKKNPFRQGHELSLRLEEFQETIGSDQFCYPGEAQDELYEPAIHLDTSDDSGWLLIRKSRDKSEPSQVWYGNIGSGNTLMRNAQERDRLRNKYDLIGLEMEAAGVMNILPTAVICGVCDYGDEYKAKLWQPYAALVAAVYAKTILLGIAPKVSLNQHEPVAHTLPFPRNEDVVVRKDLFHALEQLLPAQDTYQTAALWGLGGSGKTQLALEFAYRYHVNHHFPVFWVHANDYNKFLDGYQQIAAIAGLNTDLQAENMLMAVRRWLEGRSRWLLVLDNADEVNLFMPSKSGSSLDSHTSLHQYIPRGAYGSVLWTTRDNAAVGSLVTSQRGLNVVPMIPVEAECLLVNITRRSVASEEKATVSELLDHLDYLPLAIVQAASYIHEIKLSYSGYLSRFQQQRKRWKLLAVDRSQPFRQDGVSNSVMHTWQITMNHLGSRHPLSAWMLQVIAWFHHQSIPQSLLDATGRYFSIQRGQLRTSNPDPRTPQSSGSASAWNVNDSTDTDSDEEHDHTQEALTKMEQFSFLRQKSMPGNEPVYVMHKLVQEVAQYTACQIGKQGNLNHMADVAFDILDQSFPSADYENWDTCKKLLLHAIAVCNRTQLSARKSDVYRLLHRASEYLSRQGRYREAQMIRLQVAALLKEMHGEKHLDTITSMNNLAATYYSQGDLNAAETILLDVMTLRRQLLGEEHPATLMTMFNLASIASERGQYNEAESLALQVLTRRQQNFDEPDVGIADSMDSLAGIYLRQGRLVKAEECGVQAVAARKKLFGEKHPWTASSMAHLAGVYLAQGNYREAEELSLQVLATRQEILDESHPGIAQAMRDLSVVYSRQGRYNEAETKLLQVVASQKETRGENHPVMWWSLADLAWVYHHQGRLHEAEKVYLQVVAGLTKTSGKKHPYTLKNMTDLAMVYHDQKRSEEAENIILNNTLPFQQEALGNEHPSTVRIAFYLAQVYLDQGRIEEAGTLLNSWPLPAQRSMEYEYCLRQQQRLRDERNQQNSSMTESHDVQQ